MTTWGNTPGNTRGIPPRKPYLRDQGVEQGEQGIYVVWNDRLSNLQPRRRLTVTVARICKKGLCRDKPGEYIHFGKVPQLIDRRFATCRPLLESLVGRRHANEENAAVIRNLHRGGAECRAGGSDNSSVPEAEYPSREDAPVADTAASSRRLGGAHCVFPYT